MLRFGFFTVVSGNIYTPQIGKVNRLSLSRLPDEPFNKAPFWATMVSMNPVQGHNAPEPKPFYITTTLPYLNSEPHIGFALEIIQADVIARHKRMTGHEVFFNTGTDEHGLKIYEKATEAGLSAKDFTDQLVGKFQALKDQLNLSFTHFIRTTDANHIAAAQAFWNRCLEKGDIYKGEYEAKYCVGCELEKSDSELVDGRCPLHPTGEIQIIKEENYFFKYSNYQQKLLELYDINPSFVIPESRMNEIKSFVAGGLHDFSISRRKEKMPWGVPVPNDDDHVMYVWFDALVSYISTIGWPNDTVEFEKFWPGMQVAGKDNLRQQSAMWQAMLMSATLPTSTQIFIHGFITSGGQKMSKSLGNVINPLDIVNEYGADALRYFIAHQLPSYEDGDFTMERFKESYNTQLANGIGNLTSRILRMAVSYGISFEGIVGEATKRNGAELFDLLEAPLARFNFMEAADLIWRRIAQLDLFVQEKEPFKKIKTDPEGAKADVRYLLEELYKVAYALAPFMPDTSEKIIALLSAGKFPDEPLFARKD
jgi:methionyl-tRNA synthetase